VATLDRGTVTPVRRGNLAGLFLVGEWNGVELDDLVLQSQRLTLRPFQADDAGAVEAIMADDRMHPYLDLPRPYTKADATYFVTERAVQARIEASELVCALVETTSGRVVGAAGLKIPRPRATSVEIGYWIGATDWNRGYATEATRTLADFAFRSGAARVEILTYVTNAASAAVALKAGFRFEGISRHRQVADDGPVDCALFGRVATDAGLPVPPTWPALPDGGLSDGVVIVRNLRADDWPTMMAENNNAESRRWSLFADDLTEEQARLQAAKAALDRLVQPTIRFLIVDVATGSGAGGIVLRAFGPPGVANVGYGLVPEFRGRRYTTRALRLLTDWAFEHTDFVRLELGCKDQNLASARAAESAGFVREGVFAGRLRNRDGTYSDEIRYGLTKLRA